MDFLFDIHSKNKFQATNRQTLVSQFRKAMKPLTITALLPLCALLSIPLLSGCRSSRTDIDTRSVRKLDINKYMGRWYEIARFDHRFERGLVGVTAEYRLLPNGKIQVLNSGYEHSFDGTHKTIAGKASQPDPLEPGRLKVSFFPLVSSDYYILELDEVHYSFALIGSSSDRYLWILSRTAELPEDTKEYLLDRAKARGYDTSRLYWTPQPKIRPSAETHSPSGNS